MLTKRFFVYTIQSFINYLTIMEKFKDSFRKAWRENFSHDFWELLLLLSVLVVVICSVGCAFVFGETIGFTAVGAWLWAGFIFATASPYDTLAAKLQELFTSYVLWAAFLGSFHFLGTIAWKIVPLGDEVGFYPTVLYGIVSVAAILAAFAVCSAVCSMTQKDYTFSVRGFIFVFKWLVVFAVFAAIIWSFWTYVIPLMQ